MDRPWFFNASLATKNMDSQGKLVSVQFESHDLLVGGLEHFLFSIYWESSSQLTNIFQRGSNHQPVYHPVAY